MYNGIGLTTPRGSGTNGYVQRNAAFVKRHADKVDYKSEEEMRRADSVMFKEPNRDILEHERKRKIEVKCLEMEELMEEQGYSAEDISKKVANFRKFLAQQSAGLEASSSTVDDSVRDAGTGRPVAKGTHAEQSARQQQEETVRNALGIGKDHVPGKSLMRRPTAETAAAVAASADKLPYLRSDSSDSSSSSDSETEAAKAKKRKRKRKKEKKEKERKRKKEKKEAKRRRKEKAAD